MIHRNQDIYTQKLANQPLQPTHENILQHLYRYASYYGQPYSKIYMSLPTEDSIRILVLHSGTPGSFISCSLQESRLGDAKSPYEALSYVWKPREGNEYKSIRLNGHTKTDVGVNLYNALQRLRHTDKDRLLWVDALCINQEHLEEKGKQVKMMKSIYAGADRVIVWLGDDEQGYAREAFATLCAVVNYRNSLSDSGIFQKVEYEASDDRGILTKEAEPRAYDEEWVHVNMLFANKWYVAGNLYSWGSGLISYLGSCACGFCRRSFWPAKPPSSGEPAPSHGASWPMPFAKSARTRNCAVWFRPATSRMHS